MKSRTGYIGKRGKKWMARLTFTDPATGQRQEVRRFRDTKSEAQEALQELRETHRRHGAEALDGERMTVNDLIAHYIKSRLKPAEYHNDRKIAGMRSHVSALQHIEAIKKVFGRRTIKSLKPSDLEAYKEARLKQPTKRGTERTIASANRELETFRAALNFAKQQGWLIVSPFERARGIISKTDEVKRERVISLSEESRLLDACTGKRSHLRPILICALDTAMRRGEILKLRWRDVDLLARTITITALNSKTARARQVGITSRLLTELEGIWRISPQDPDELVFGIKDNFKRSWTEAVKEAELENVRFHDTRHTCVTRWVQSGMPIPEIMRLSGHSTLAAFAIYANATEQTTKRGADALDAWREEFSIQPASALVN